MVIIIISVVIIIIITINITVTPNYMSVVINPKALLT